MSDISILLPSLREKEVNIVIDEFAKTNRNVNYEIVVVSPFEVKGEKVVYVKEECSARSVSATRNAYFNSSSNYVVYFSDDCHPTNNCLYEMLNFVDGKKVPFIGAFKMLQGNREIGPFKCYNLGYACYGCTSKENIAKIGDAVFNKQFLYSWADCDLALRIWEIGGIVETCSKAIVNPKQIEDSIYLDHRKTFEKDFNVFCDIWHEKLGKSISREIGAINHK